MKTLRRFWGWLKEKITGRKYFISVDPARVDGDYSCVVTGYRDRKGIVYIETTQYTGEG